MVEKKTVEIKKETVERIEKLIKKHPEYGYKTISDFVEDAITGGFKKIRRILYFYTVIFVSLILFLAYLILTNV